MPVQNAKHLAPFIQGKLLREAPEVAAMVVARYGATLRAATINRRLAVLKAAAKYAWKRGWIGENVSGRITMLTERNKRETFLTVQEVKKLASGASIQLAPIIILAAYTGLRAGELLSLTRRDIGRESLSVRQSKTGKPRTVPVPLPAQPYLAALPVGLSYMQLNWQFRKARKAAGMEHVRFHDLRHTAASWLVNAGVDLFTIGRILGHETPITTARYSHLQQETLKRAMGKLK